MARKPLRPHHFEHVAFKPTNCNQMHYYVWGAVERDTSRTPCNTKPERVKRVKTLLSRLSRHTVRAARDRLRSGAGWRQWRMLTPEGGNFDPDGD